MVEIDESESIDYLKKLFHKAWLDILSIFNGPNYECHQRYVIFIDCFTYGFSYGESFDCARTSKSLPIIIFEVYGECQKLA
jgi:hypothetical protein